MKRRGSFFPVFFVFVLLTLFLFTLEKAGFLNYVKSPFEKIFSSLQSININIFNGLTGFGENKEIADLKKENRELLIKLVDQNILQKDVAALKDQFEISNPPSKNLIPAKVVGLLGFVPGISKPESIIIDKGKSDNLKTGQAVIFKDNVVGKITNVSRNLSRVTLVTNNSFSLTVKTLETGAMGVIKGQGNGELLLDNVILSENLKNGDLVVSTGNIETNGLGFPPDLIAGKILSVEKKSSALFQTARVESMLDFSKLTTVFIVTGF